MSDNTCLRCGTPLIVNAKFCYNCGAPITRSQTNKLEPGTELPVLPPTGSSSFPAKVVLKLGGVTIASIRTKDIPLTGYVIGRSGEGVKPDLDLTEYGTPEQSQFVSRRHAVINRTGSDGLTITDGGSANGTLKNGVQLGRGVPHVLYDNDKLCFGKVIVEVYSAP